MEQVVYQITKLPSSPDERPIVLALTSKQSAQRLIAAYAEQGEAERLQADQLQPPGASGVESGGLSAIRAGFLTGHRVWRSARRGVAGTAV